MAWIQTEFEQRARVASLHAPPACDAGIPPHRQTRGPPLAFLPADPLPPDISPPPARSTAASARASAWTHLASTPSQLPPLPSSTHTQPPSCAMRRVLAVPRVEEELQQWQAPEVATYAPPPTARRPSLAPAAGGQPAASLPMVFCMEGFEQEAAPVQDPVSESAIRTAETVARLLAPASDDDAQVGRCLRVAGALRPLACHAQPTCLPHPPTPLTPMP